MGKFKFIKTELPGVLIVEPTVFGDERGYFMETFQKEEFAAAGITDEFVQDNQSRSSRGVLRGVHFQKEPGARCSTWRWTAGRRAPPSAGGPAWF